MRTTPRRLHRTHFAAAFALLAPCLLAPAAARAQWTPPDSNNNINNTNTGNVGVGTSAPNSRLEVQGAASRGTVAVIGDGDSVGYSGIKIQARTTTNIATNRASMFFLSMRKDGWYSGDTSGPSFIIETGSPNGNFAAPFMIKPNNDVILNGGRGAVGLGVGWVGVGTTTPANNLHVNSQYTFGAIRVSGYGGGVMNFEDTAAPADQSLYQWKSEGGVFRMSLASNTAGVLRQNILVANSSGNVGIGTASPAQLLDLNGAGDVKARATGANSAAVMLQEGAGTATWSEWQQFADRLRLNTHDGTTVRADVLSVLPGGSVGVGTPAPNSLYKLDVNGSVNATGLCLGGVCKANWSEVGGGASQWVGGTSGAISYSAGNVGVGTASPTAKLHVHTPDTSLVTINSSGGASAGRSAIQLLRGGNTGWDFGSNVALSDDAFTVRELGPRFLAYRLFIQKETGHVGVGTTSPSTRLHVAGGARVEGEGRVYLGTGAAPGARGLEFVEESATTFSIRHHDPNVAWRNIALNPYAGGVGVNTLNPLGPLSVGDSSAGGSDGYLVIGKNSGGGSRHFRVGFDAGFNFVIGDYGYNNVAGAWTSPFAINWQAPSGSFYINPAGRVGIGKTDPREALDVAGNITATGSIAASFQDVAEWVPSTQRLSAGTVVVLDADRTNHVVASGAAYDTKVAGVVSAQPGLLLGVGGDGKVMVATTGRVKVRVDATRAPIRIGDLIVTSDQHGMAMRSEPISIGGRQIHAPGTIIGKALEPLEKGVGEILVLLSLQ